MRSWYVHIESMDSLECLPSSPEYVTGRAILCQKPGGTDVLQLVSDYRVPVPKTKGELLVKLASTGVNRCECGVQSQHLISQGS